MKKMVTIADIANALGLSRNTVSKALNGQHVMPKTRQLVINTAISMGYKSFDVISTNKDMGQKRILILSSVPLLSSNYYIYLLKGISSEAERRGFEVMQYFFRPHSNFGALKSYIAQIEINGIICIEFFNEKMVAEITSLNIPTVFLDYPTYECNLSGNFDVLLSESIISVSNACKLMIDKGIRLFSFIGNPENCRSFYERYLGMREALYRNKLPFAEENNITDSNLSVYNEVNILAKRISALPVFPECFVCSNDYIALKVLEALKLLKKANFNRVNVIGFDNGPESKLSSPKLSTVNIDKATLGSNAVHILAERMANKKSPCKIIYTGTNFISRETTTVLNHNK